MNGTTRIRLAAVTAASGLALLGTAVLAGPAAAHTPTVDAGCTQAASYLHVGLTNYNAGGTNTVKVTLDGATVADTTFTTSYSLTRDDLTSDGQHAYRVVVDAWDDDGSKGFDLDKAGTIAACSSPTPEPTTPAPTTPSPTTSPPTTPAPTTEPPTSTPPPTTPAPLPPVSTPAPTTPAPVPTFPAPTSSPTRSQPAPVPAPSTTHSTPAKAPKIPVLTRPKPSPSATPVPVTTAPTNLAYTGTSATVQLLWSGGILLVFGALILAIPALRKRAAR